MSALNAFYTTGPHEVLFGHFENDMLHLTAIKIQYAGIVM